MQGYDRDDYCQSSDEYEDYEDDEDGEEYEEEEEEEDKKLPYDNFGSFFGPSQPVIAERVIQESKSLLETKHVTSSATNSIHHNKKSSGSTSAGSKSVSNFEFEDKVINLFKDFMFRLGNFDELVATGSTLLVDFQQGLEFLRRPRIDETSDLVKNIILGNETKRVKSYVEVGCLNADDGRRNISK